MSFTLLSTLPLHVLIEEYTLYYICLYFIDRLSKSYEDEELSGLI